MKIYSYEGKKNICGERVRARRLRLRMSQSDLAEIGRASCRERV